jgi:hypothetical protein
LQQGDAASIRKNEASIGRGQESREKRKEPGVFARGGKEKVRGQGESEESV